MKRLRRMLACMVLCCMICSLFAACGGTTKETKTGVIQSINDIKQRGYLSIGVYKDNKPFSYLDDAGEYRGFDICLGKRLAEDLGVRPQFIPVEAENREEVLRDFKADVVLAGYSTEEAHRNEVALAMAYRKVGLGIVSSKKNSINEISELKNKVVLVIQGSRAEQYLAENHKEIRLIRLSQYEEAFRGLEEGLGEAFCSDDAQLVAWMQEKQEFTMNLVIPGTRIQIAPAVEKNEEELLEWVNDEITSLQKEGFFEKLYEETLYPVFKDKVTKDDLLLS